MVKYIIEDNIDFWKEINDVNTVDNVDNICLISKEPLCVNHITLPCNHKFNYIPLFKEIKSIKFNNSNYYSNLKLNKTQIFCPYCRNITNGLLPYIPNIIEKKYYNINYPIKNCLPFLNCTFKNKKNICCNSHNAYNFNNNIYCLKHHTLIEKKNNLLNLKDSMTKEMLDYSKKHNIKQIKNILKSNKIKTTGLKNELVIRIFENKLN